MVEVREKQKPPVPSTREEFKEAIAKQFPALALDYSLDESNNFTDPLTKQFWGLYCQGKEDGKRFQPGGHIIARVDTDGLQIAREASIVRHTGSIARIIAGLKARHGGSYVTLSIPEHNVRFIKMLFGMRFEDSLDRLPIRVVNHNPVQKRPK